MQNLSYHLRPKLQELQPQNCLIVAPNWVGDLIMSYPLIYGLKQILPTLQIDLFAPKWNMDVASFMPEINQLIENPLQHGKLRFNSIRKKAEELKHDYDWSIILPNSLKSSLIPYLSKARTRTGYSGEVRFLTLNDRLKKDKTIPLVEQYFSLAFHEWQEIPQPKLKIEENQAKELITQYTPEGSNFKKIGFCPGAEYGPAKRWPTKYFADLGMKLLEKGYEIFLYGSNKDESICNEIAEFMENKCYNLSGKTNLKEAILLLSQMDKIVTNDSGLMHIGAVLDKPLYCLYGSSSTYNTPPQTDKAEIFYLNLDCSPCFKRECPLGHLNCLNQLYPEMVFEKMMETS